MTKPRLSMKLLWEYSGDFTAQPEEQDKRIALNRFLNFVDGRMKHASQPKEIKQRTKRATKH